VRAPAGLLAIPLAAGCAAGLLVADRAPGALRLYAAAAALLALLAAVASLFDDDAPFVTVSVVVGAALAGLSLGTSAAAHAYSPALLRWFASIPGGSRSPVVLLGTIREDAAMTPTGVALLVDVDEISGVSTSGGVRLSVAGTMAPAVMGEWRAGRAVRVTAQLRHPVAYRNPGVPDERRALARRGIALVGSVKSAALVEVVGRGSVIDEWTAGVRAWTRSTLAANIGIWSGRSAGVASAIAIGDRTGLSPDDERRLQEAGTYHVIAISGGNIAILTLLLVGALRLLGVPPRASGGATIIALLFYGRVTGSSPSVDRAISAAAIYLAGRMLELRGPSINVLAAVAILGVAVSPATVFDPGFVLSFGGTLGILVGVPRIVSRPSVSPPVALIAATIAAELVLAPITAALFARVTFAGLLLNFVAIPLMAVVQAAALATLAAAAFLPDLAAGSGYIVHVAATGLVDSARLVDVAPWLSVDTVPPAWGLVALYYSAWILALSRTRLASGAQVAAASTALLVVIGPHAASRDGVPLPPPATLRVVFMDVGQGDSTLIRLPDGRAFLVDAGGLPAVALQDPLEGPTFDIGDRVVARTLRAFGVRSLDTFVLTHADPDHIGGGQRLLRAFRPRGIWEGVPVPGHPARAALLGAARGLGAEWRTVQSGDRLQVAGIDIDVVHPPPPDWERQRVRNDDSVVVVVRYGQLQLILPGDIGREGEHQALTRLMPSPITVLKAAHHGSATSSTPEFLAATRPHAVIFSAGRDNRFGHPAPVVEARYRAMGAAILSTAGDGAVILDTDGRRVQITGWSSRRVVVLDSTRRRTGGDSQ
jgi:competence protein ComEC